MRNETYKLRSKDRMTTFEFISEGPKGLIKKRVEYQKTAFPSLYNLAFGDVNVVTNDIDDKVITDNKDTEKVLATVAATIYAFMDIYPEAHIYVTGSTFTRTRLYRIAISNNLEEINKTFKVYGVLKGNILVDYEKNNDYSAFLIVKK